MNGRPLPLVKFKRLRTLISFVQWTRGGAVLEGLERIEDDEELGVVTTFGRDLFFGDFPRRLFPRADVGGVGNFFTPPDADAPFGSKLSTTTRPRMRLTTGECLPLGPK